MTFSLAKMLMTCYVLAISVCMLSGAQLFATLWTGAHQVPLVHGILQARILEWAAIPSSKGSSQPRDQTRIPCFLHCRRILYH